MRLSVSRRDVVFLALSCALVGLYVLPAGGGFPLDDSWIHQTYGRNLGIHGEWAFVLGQPSAASTSPLYTLLLAVGYRLGIPYVLWTHLLGALTLAVTGMLGALLAERALPTSKWVGWGAGLALISTWHLIWAAASGMETMLFSMFTLVLFTAAWRVLAQSAQTTRASVFGGVGYGVLSALAMLTRPEGIALAGILGLVVAASLPRSALGKGIVWAVSASVGFLITSSPYLLLNYQLTGGLLPNTASAKQAEYAFLLEDPYLLRVWTMILPLTAGGQFLLLPGMLAYLVFPTRMAERRYWPVLMLLVVWPLLLIALYAARLPAPYQHGRYVIPALPGLIVAGVVGTMWMLTALRTRAAGRVFSRVLAISAVLGLAYFGLVLGREAYMRDVAIIQEEMVASSMWIAQHVDADDLLAVHDIGAVGYFAPRPLLDLAGLVSPEVIALFHQNEALWALIRERDIRYLMGFPEHIPGGRADLPWLCERFSSGGTTAHIAGGNNMAVYEIVWDERCT